MFPSSKNHNTSFQHISSSRHNTSKKIRKPCKRKVKNGEKVNFRFLILTFVSFLVAAIVEKMMLQTSKADLQAKPSSRSDIHKIKYFFKDQRTIYPTKFRRRDFYWHYCIFLWDFDTQRSLVWYSRNRILQSTSFAVHSLHTHHIGSPGWLNRYQSLNPI